MEWLLGRLPGLCRHSETTPHAPHNCASADHPHILSYTVARVATREEDGERVAITVVLQVLAHELVDEEVLVRQSGLGHVLAKQEALPSLSVAVLKQFTSRTPTPLLVRTWSSSAANTSARMRALSCPSDPRASSVSFSTGSCRIRLVSALAVQRLNRDVHSRYAPSLRSERLAPPSVLLIASS